MVTMQGHKHSKSEQWGMGIVVSCLKKSPLRKDCLETTWENNMVKIDLSDYTSSFQLHQIQAFVWSFIPEEMDMARKREQKDTFQKNHWQLPTKPVPKDLRLILSEGFLHPPKFFSSNFGPSPFFISCNFTASTGCSYWSHCLCPDHSLVQKISYTGCLIKHMEKHPNE